MLRLSCGGNAGLEPRRMLPLLLLCALQGLLSVGGVAATSHSRGMAGAQILAALLGARKVAYASPCVHGLDYLDLISGGYGLHSNATNPRDCCGACGEQPGCQHFAWVHAHQAVGPVRGVSAPPGCWLKLEGVVWTRRMNTPTRGNRAPPTAAGDQTASSIPMAPTRPGTITPAVGYEAAYVVVGGDCLHTDSCNATLGACDEPEENSTLSACGHCLGGSIHAPTGGSRGECPENGDLLHGESCNVACPEGMFPSGEHPMCRDGAVVGQKGGAYRITCEPCAQCEGIHAPKDGTMGDCPLDGTLPWNQGCIQRCNPDFIVVNTSHHPYCSCGASGGPQLSAQSVQCEPCSTCADWGVFIFALMVGGPACCVYVIYYFQLLPRRLRRKVRKVTPKRCKSKPAAQPSGA